MIVTLKPLSSGLFHYSGDQDGAQNLFRHEDPGAPPAGSAWIRGSDLDALIFTEQTVDVRAHGPWLAPGIPSYLAIPEGSSLPLASSAPGETLTVDRRYLEVITHSKFFGSYRISKSGLSYAPPPNLPGSAFELFGHHLASSDEKIQIGHRAVSIVSATALGDDCGFKRGLILPIRTLEEAPALGLAVHAAAAISPGGLLVTDITIIDSEIAGRSADWLASVPKWSRITYVSNYRETDCLGVPLSFVPNLSVPRGHWYVLRESLLIPDRLLELRSGSGPIPLGGDRLIFLADPWHLNRPEICQGQEACNFHGLPEEPLYLTNNIILRMRDFQLDRLHLDGPDVDDDLPF